MNLDPTEGLAIFTDGSCYRVDGTGGWAWVALDAYEGIHTDAGFVPHTTNNRMELSAPTEALVALADAFGPLDVQIYSDSQYVVLGATDRSRKRTKNRLWWKRLDAAIELHRYVEFHHVKGHNDNLYNEMADELAGNARRTRLSGGSA